MHVQNLVIADLAATQRALKNWHPELTKGATPGKNHDIAGHIFKKFGSLAHMPPNRRS